MNAALIAGLLSGVAGLLVFLTIHHFWIKPIWFILPVGLLIAGLGGLVVGWSYAEIQGGLPPRPWTALAMFVVISATLIPAILLAPFILLALIVACLISGVPFWRSIATFWALLCSLPGTDVRVATEGNRVLVRIL